jgi:hypothetical protein
MSCNHTPLEPDHKIFAFAITRNLRAAFMQGPPLQTGEWSCMRERRYRAGRSTLRPPMLFFWPTTISMGPLTALPAATGRRAPSIPTAGGLFSGTAVLPFSERMLSARP